MKHEHDPVYLYQQQDTSRNNFLFPIFIFLQNLRAEFAMEGQK